YAVRYALRCTPGFPHALAPAPPADPCCPRHMSGEGRGAGVLSSRAPALVADGPGEHAVGRRGAVPGARRSDADLHAQLDDAIDGQAEEPRRREGVARQEDEQPLAPVRHGALAAGDYAIVAEDIRDQRRID